MKPKIIYIHRGDFHKRPPVISAVLNLLDLGYKVILITCEINDHFRKILDEKGVKIHIVKFTYRNSLYRKVTDNIKYRFKVQKILKQYSYLEYLIWLEGSYTFKALVFSLVSKFRLILQIQELYASTSDFYATRVLIKHSSIIFMPEYNRSIYYQVKFKIKKRPYILPNKPYFSLNTQQINSFKDKYTEFRASTKGKKIILYQGILTKERDLSYILSDFTKLDESYVLVLLGPDLGMLESYRKINKNFIHMDFIPAPEYLYITSLAYIGIVTYSLDTLNSAYCAPNKIYEYASFGIPMVANDNPGLKYTVGQFNTGVIMSDLVGFKDAINLIEEKYTEFSRNSRLFFESTDSKIIIKNALASVE